jgi:protein-tyrosine phosphatase
MEKPKILMVCLGNICRSPLAEGIFRAKAQEAGLDCLVDSAGTGSWHIGHPPHPLSQKVAAMHDIDISHLKARRFHAGDMEVFDRIYFMDENNLKDAREMAGHRWQHHKAALLLEATPHLGIREVPDPYFGEFDGYMEVFHMISEACETIVRDLADFASQP